MITLDSNLIGTSTGIVLSNNNCTATSGTTVVAIKATNYKTSGKYYWEVYIDNFGTNVRIGVVNFSFSSNALGGDPSGNSIAYQTNASYYYNGSSTTSFASTATTGDTVGVALDIDGNTISFYKNGTFMGTIPKPLPTGNLYPAISFGSVSSTVTIKFSTTLFNYSIPSGYAPFDFNVKYLIRDKNNTIYTYDNINNNIIQSISQELNSNNFKENGFNDPLLITEEQWDDTFPNKIGLQLLKWTDDTNINESTITCNIEPYSYKPIDQFGENKILAASFSTTDNKTFTVDPLTNVPFKQNSVVCYKDGIEVTPDEINYDEGIVVFNTEQIGIITFDYTYIIPFDILLYKPN